ncbi:MAG: DNA repair exonuclease [Candidatus Cloacimonetes bacterium]|nr:DNA repair exonuclease [Candidatus Cloacimonadota bacterium]
MIKILLTADSHLGFDDPVRPRIQRRRRGPDFFDNFRKILQAAAEDEVDLLIHGGDLFFRSRISQQLANRVYREIFNIAEQGIKVVIVPGNHEHSFLPQSLLTCHPDIYVFHRPLIYKFTIRGIRLSLYGFPFVRDEIQHVFPFIIKTLQENDSDADMRILCLHQIVENACVGPGNHIFRKGPDIIPLKMIPDCFRAVLCGHIHRQQIIWKESGERLIPIIYPGSSERTSFAERNEAKGFYIITIDQERIFPRLMILNTRPMKDIILEGYYHNCSELQEALLGKSSRLSPETVIRIKMLQPENLRHLHMSQLRQILPPGAVITVSCPSRKKPHHARY